MAEKGEAYWAYSISIERVIKRLLDKGYMTPVEADETSQQLFERITEGDVENFRVTGGCARTLRIYLKPNATNNEYVSLTEIAREKDDESPSYVIQSWLRSRNTVEFLRLWEKEYNPIFEENGCNTLLEAMKTASFTLTPKQWITKTNAVGLISKQGKNGGTLAHPDIEIDFHMWLYPELRLNLIKIFRKS
jgi:hypothetical protein